MDLSFHKDALINRAPRVQFLIVRGITHIYWHFVVLVQAEQLANSCIHFHKEFILSLYTPNDTAVI